MDARCPARIGRNRDAVGRVGHIIVNRTGKILRLELLVDVGLRTHQENAPELVGRRPVSEAIEHVGSQQRIAAHLSEREAEKLAGQGVAYGVGIALGVGEDGTPGDFRQRANVRSSSQSISLKRRDE